MKLQITTQNNITMNRLFAFAALAVLINACAPEVSEKEQLMTQKNGLKKEIATLSSELAAVESKLAKYETKKRYALVTKLPVQETAFGHYIEVQGTVEADKNVIIYPELGGVVKSIAVSEGQKVSKGQVLVVLDTEVLQLQIKELETRLELATTTFERQERLWNKKIGSEMQYLQAKNNKQSLEDNIKSLKAQLGKNRIKAPFSGIVDEIWPKIGELTAPQTPVLRLVDLEKIHVEADVSESYIAKVGIGTKVDVIFPALNQTIHSNIKMVGNFINPNNRTFKISVDVSNQQALVKPNMMAYIKVQDFYADSALLVPERLVQETPSGEKFLYVLSSNKKQSKVKKLTVKVGLTYNNLTHIVSGLSANQVLVDEGARSIKDEQVVTVIN